jgi:hypothetical protein
MGEKMKGYYNVKFLRPTHAKRALIALWRGLYQQLPNGATVCHFQRLAGIEEREMFPGRLAEIDQ